MGRIHTLLELCTCSGHPDNPVDVELETAFRAPPARTNGVSRMIVLAGQVRLLRSTRRGHSPG
jgi:hypothetical protein